MANQPSVKRTSQQLTVAGQKRMQAVTVPAVRAVNADLKGNQITPHQMLGMDFVDVKLHIGNKNQGTGATLTGTATFSNLTSVATGPNDTLKLHVHMTVDNPIGNLAVSGWSITPMIKDKTNLTNAVNTGPNISGVRNTVLYQGAISVTVIAVNASPAGDITCHCLGYLGLQPG